MSIRISCSSCGAEFRVEDRFSGKKISCRYCRNPVVVPRKRQPAVTKSTSDIPTPPPLPAVASSTPSSAAYRYDAFVSYRREDPDRNWAKWLVDELETYRTPRRLCRDNPQVRPRIKRVFRDEEELSATSDMDERLKEMLYDSRYLIVVCSPKSRKSEYVNQEIEWFNNLGRSQCVLLLLVAGDKDTAFPPALVTSPMAPNVSNIEFESMTGSRRQTLFRLISEALGREIDDQPRQALLRLAARLLGCEYDDLHRREKQRRRRIAVTRLSAIMAILISFSVMLAFAVQTMFQRDQALDLVERKDEEIGKEKQFSGEITQVANRRAYQRSISAAYRDFRDNNINPAREKLQTAADFDQLDWEFYYCRRIFSREHLTLSGKTVTFTPDGSSIATAAAGRITFWDVETGARKSTLEPLPERIVSVDFRNDGQRLLAVSRNGSIAV